MNVASLELCKELFELSGWETTEHHLVEDIPFPVTYPAYDLSFLTRKLPAVYENGGLIVTKQADIWGSGYGAAYMTDQMNFLLKQIADTPEDALAKLAIELFKANILVKGETSNEQTRA